MMPFLRIPNRTYRYNSPTVVKGQALLFFRAALVVVFGLAFRGNAASPLNAQSHLFNARMLTPEDGLANLMTTSIYKDKQGFIWAGTAYGLNRYDGYNFKLFTREENNLEGNAHIARISEDEEGRLWLFYRDGLHVIPKPYEIFALDVFDPRTEQAVPFDAFFSGNIPFEVGDIYLPKIIDPQNRLWIHTNKGELFFYEHGRFKKIFQQGGVFFQYITIDNEENIWLGWKNNLMAIDLSGKILAKMNLPDELIGVWAEPDGNLWVSTQEAKEQPVSLWRKPKNGSLVPFELTRDNQAVELQPMNPFLYLNQSGYWFAKTDNRLELFDHQGKWLCSYNTLLGKNPNLNFFSYLEDGDRLWLASASGILNVSARANPFVLVHKQENMLSDSRSVTEDQNGNIYFLNKNVYQWNVQTKKCAQLPNSMGAAYALLYADSVLWASTYGPSPAGFELDLRTGSRTEYVPFSPKLFLVQSLTKTKESGRYLAGIDKGLVYLDLTKKEFLPYTGYRPNNEKDSLLEQSSVNFIHKNALGLWLATDKGVFLLKENEGVIRHYDKTTGDLPFDHIRHIYEDAEGVFWLATKGGGVIRWQPALSMENGQVRNSSNGKAQGAYTQLTGEEGLTDNFTYAVYEDDYGKLWIPSDKGLMQMDKVSFRIRTFTAYDGLSHNEFNFSAHYQAKDGTLYFGGLGGLIAFHPSVFAEENLNSTPLAFTGFYVLEEHADKMANRTNLLQESGDITIRPSDKFFELHFTLLDFDDVEQHQYAYQIEGYSNNWNYISENFIRITHLPYGKYTLRIQGQNSNRGWSEQELSLAIRVLKPFYLQWWFMIALAILTVSLLLTAMQWRIRELKKRKERLEEEVQKRTLTIKQQAEELKALDKAKTRFFSNITHEFRTPLTLIIGPVEQLLNDSLPKAARRRLSGVAKNARQLLSLINQLLDLSKLESGRMKVEAARGDIARYTRELVQRLQPLAVQKDQRLAFVSNQDNWETHFDQGKWDKIIYNLTANAIKFTPEGGAIQLSLSKMIGQGEEWIHLTVKDTGPGMEKAQLERIFDRFYQADDSSTRAQGGTGIGLSLVKELVELQGGEIQVASTVGQGASFEVRLPVLQVENPAPSLAALPAEWEVQSPVGLDEPSLIKEALPKSVTNEEKLELLVVEDNSEMREYIRYCLDETKYNITEAGDGEEGIKKAQALIPDLIISDVMMPKKNGFALTEAIRGHTATSHIPLILLTAKASLESRLQGLRRGADAYLTKPFSPQELALRIEKLIEIRLLLQQRYQNGPPPAADDAYRQEDEFIADLRTYIVEHIDEADLGVDHLCKHVGMSRVHLYRKMKALTDQGAGEFVRAIRLETAYNLIRENRLILSEIAYRTGFSSLSHFSRTFKKVYGKSPSDLKGSA